MRRAIYILLALVASFCSTSTYAQSTSTYFLKGNVIDKTGETIIGASIRLKGTSQGTITDFDGNFSLKVSNRKQILVISYVGFKTQEIQLEANSNNLKVTLEDDAQNLNEIVVIGYGTQKKSSLTSSVETIKSDDIMQIPTADLDKALSGQAAGLQVMSSTGDPSSAKEATIRIRGIAGAPLLVIDGVPRFGTNTSDGETRLSDLNPDDIESISILKDAAAAAVYGARAANGVILVQTKRAKKGSKIKINYRNQFNLQQATRLPEFLNAYEFAKLYNTAIANSPGSTYTPYTEEQLEAIRTHSKPNEYGDENLIDYLDKFGYSSIQSLSMSGGNENVRYYLSGGYTKTKGLYGGVGKDRYNYSAKIDATLLKGLTFALDFSGRNASNKNTSYSTISSAYNFSPLNPLRFTTGQLASNNGGNPLIPVEGLGGYIEDNSNMSTITATLRYESQQIKGLSAYVRATFDHNTSRRKIFNKPVTLFLYDKNDGSFKEDPLTTYPKAKITLQQENRFVDNNLLEAGLNYTQTFGKHSVSGLVVVNYQEYKNNYLSGTNLDMPGIYPEIIGTAIQARLTGKEYFNQRASLIGRATYGYNNCYFIESSFRMDGSTKFSPENRWGVFPTVSASWVISNEKFFKNWNQNILSNVKLRGSMGILGDDGGVEDFSYLMKYMYAVRQGYNIDGNYKPGVVLDTSSFPNPDLKWGESRDYNIATDLGFFGNRLGISLEYYWRYRSNMIMTAPSYLYPASTGVDSNPPSVNFGKVKGWGWDLTITHRNTIKDFKYNATLTLAQTDDKVLDYGDESSLAENRRRIGKNYRVWWMYEADGLFQSWEEIANHPLDQDGQGNATIAPGDIKYIDQNTDGVLTDADRIAVKNSSYPEMSMSLRLGAQYKGFFVNVMFQGVTGYQQTIGEMYSLENSSLQRFQQYHLTDTWSENNKNARYPRIKFANSNDNNRRSSTFWVKDCDFIRLKSVSLGYRLPRKLTKKLSLSSASISINGSNLYTWSSLKDMDPESLRGYPIQRSYGVTLNVGF